MTLPLLKQAKKTSEKNKRIKTNEKDYGEYKRILAYLVQFDSAKTGELADWLDLSEARTRAILKEMLDEGMIVSRGKTKKKEYYLEKEKAVQAFQNVEKAFSGAAEDAGFHTESELQDYVKKIRQEKEKK